MNFNYYFFNIDCLLLIILKLSAKDLRLNGTPSNNSIFKMMITIFFMTMFRSFNFIRKKQAEGQ